MQPSDFPVAATEASEYQTAMGNAARSPKA